MTGQAVSVTQHARDPGSGPPDRAQVAAAAIAAGWLFVIVADVVLVALTPSRLAVTRARRTAPR